MADLVPPKRAGAIVFVSVAICLLLLPGTTVAQDPWDALDVVDGPNPTLRYGFLTEPDGRVDMGRYYFLDDGEQLRVVLARYGRARVELPVRSYDRAAGLLDLGWEGRPGRTCRLERQNEKLFLGSCIEELAVMPMAIRIADDRDAEWMGVSLAVSSQDLAILERAREILQEQGARNPRGDRICEDDIERQRFSVFCSLYAASMEVAGVYRHRRPALRAARKELATRFPGEYAHRLRDINNNPEIADEIFVEALGVALGKLESELRAQRDRR